MLLDMIKIAFLHSVAKIGGAERVSQMLMSNIDKSAFTPVLVCPELGSLSDWAIDQGIAFTQLPMKQPGISNAVSSLKQVMHWVKWLKAERINIIHTADPYCTRAVAIAARFAGVKVLSHFHFPFEYSHLSWLFKGIPKPSVCVFCSDDLQHELGGYLRNVSPTSRLKSIHNGVDVSRFQPTQASHSENLHIGIVANLQKRKGHDEFIQMAAILAKRYDNLHFDIIGGDILEEPREAKLKALAVDLGLGKNLTFHGQVADVQSRLAKLNIVVCASHQEAFPIAILEAMAMQKPIVSTNVNGIPEAIIDGHSGLLVKPHNAEQLAEAVARLIDAPVLQKSIAENARTRVVEHFNVGIFIDKFMRLYKEMI